MRATGLLVLFTVVAVSAGGALPDRANDTRAFRPEGELFASLDDQRLGYPDASVRRLHRLATASRPVERSAMPPRHLDAGLHPESLVDRALIVSGGPPPDAIPAIDDPSFDRAGEVDWLAAQEAVLAVDLDGSARAYPVQIMLWHEIVNDELAGIPLSVTYCPICNSAVAFHRELGGRELDFGTSGALYRGALVMYDRQTESLWTHFDGLAVIGTLLGAQLEPIPVTTVRWADFRAEHPDGEVLARQTGFRRSYGANPYGRFHGELTSPPFTYGEVDPRADPLARMVGVRGTNDHIAISAERLEEQGVVELEVDGRAVTVWHRPGLAFPVGAATVAGGQDVGATPAFFVDRFGAPVRFTAVEGGFRDSETGTTWNVFGRGIAGPLEGERLEPVPVLNTRWFAWSGYHPQTALVE
jgi:hypothetical protein